VRVESLNHEGWGVARFNGKAVFIDGALPGERVVFQTTKTRKSYDLGKVTSILEPSPDRVTPRCQYFGTCGGCSFQHLNDGAQLPAKEKILRDNFERIGKASPETWLEPLSAAHWGYRRKARLGVRVVEKKGGVIIGFRERNHSFITPLASCEVLDPRVSRLLPALRDLIAQFSRPDRVPQIEVATGDVKVALVFRHVVPLTPRDNELLVDFGKRHGIQIYRQPGRPDQLEPVWPASPEPLFYRLPEFDCVLEFAPADFIQVNADLNRLMIQQAIKLLDLKGDDRVLDLFCGLGNFSLPIARTVLQVTGVEAEISLVEKARHNAERNGVRNTNFLQGDLYHEVSPAPWETEQMCNKWLLDPPRTGAIEVVKRLSERGCPERIVYVSCNPATLARDSEVLVHAKGYRLAAAGVMDMFPQTSHVEAMALFVKAN